MRIHVGSRLELQLTQPTPMIAMLKVHASRVSDLDLPERFTTTPAVPLHPYVDAFGNRAVRFVAPAGTFGIESEAYVNDSGEPDIEGFDAAEIPVADLPNDVLPYLQASRYCDTEFLSNTAWNLFQNVTPGWGRVQAICDFVHNHLTFDYQQARATRTASEAYNEGVGVCRDFTHLGISFVRALNIPARYCTGFLGDIGMPPPYPPGDFAAYMEVYLGGKWWVFDPRNNVRRIGRILVGRGRDAADVPILHSFGANLLSGFEVWTDEVADRPDSIALSA